jgi:hypothetical protein
MLIIFFQYMLCFQMYETIDRILSLHIFCSFAQLILSENSNCVFFLSSLFDYWFEFSILFWNVIIVIASIWYGSMCVKQLVLFYLRRYFVDFLSLIWSEISYCVFFWSSLFDDWFDFQPSFEMLY